CVRHAASVHPEPGSNSHNISVLKSSCRIAAWTDGKLAFLSVSCCKTIGGLTDNEEAPLPSFLLILQEDPLSRTSGFLTVFRYCFRLRDRPLQYLQLIAVLE
ncbi:MAG: hypothetical protein LUD71_04255, partial [Clostridiales bacterium]|nr:hypothetical protein [Clostridiales bacterium]